MTEPDAQSMMKAAVAEAVHQLERAMHPTLAGLRERYYYRGSFVLPEHITAGALAWNVARCLRRWPERTATQ
jgi:cob(I)alamin adenosyltransferase